MGLGFCGSVGAVGSVRGGDGETESRGALFEFLGILFIYRLVLLVLGYRSWFEKEKEKEKGDQIRRERRKKRTSMYFAGPDPFVVVVVEVGIVVPNRFVRSVSLEGS